MLTINDLNNNIDIQCGVHYYYYDYEKEERIEISEEEAEGKEIKYLYSEFDEICIEVDMEN